MTATLAIRRLRLAAIVPHDHPAPRALKARLTDAARLKLAPALQVLLRNRDPKIVRIRRLKVDITLDAAADDDAFASVLAGAIAEALNAGAADPENVVVFADPAAYLVALIEALAAGRAHDCWWLRDAEGLRFLKPAMAIRTALLADPALGQTALLRLPSPRLAAIVAALGARESDRLLDALAAAAPTAASAEACAAAIASVVAKNSAVACHSHANAPLALYLRASAQSGIGGPALAAAARLYAALAEAETSASPQDADKIVALFSRQSGQSPGVARDFASARELSPVLAEAEASKLARLILTEAQRAKDGGEAEPQYSRFAGLALLAPGLEFDALAAEVAGWPELPADTAALIACAALGLCAGRRNFFAWLREPVWRALFGLDEDAGAPGERLAALPEDIFRALNPLGARPATQREARFLLPPRASPGFGPSCHVLAALANAIAARFARRLTGLRAVSAPFLWDNLLGAGGLFERQGEGWRVKLGRPPLDVLLSLSRMAEGEVRFPGGALILSREAP